MRVHHSHALMSQSQEIKSLIKPASAIMGEVGRQIWYFTQMINQQIVCVYIIAGISRYKLIRLTRFVGLSYTKQNNNVFVCAHLLDLHIFDYQVHV